MVEDHADAVLVEAARAGDHDAWHELYRRVYPRLRAYAVRRVGTVDAEDVVSETMVRAVGAIDRFTLTPSGFDGWLFGIARRICVDHHRAAERAARRRGRAALVTNGDESAAGVSLDEGLVLADEHAQIRRVFDQLTDAERELLELRVIAGLSADATAVALGKRPGAVRTAQSRALARLRVLLEGDDA
jgi:RNA polymerase sigma-70 factor (ECF subfamily)